MTIRYVGKGGNDANDGLSWANRKLTIDAVENTPVVKGDTVYIGPGVYREELTLDVSGEAGNIITYIGDVTGENTDGVGGAVVISATDDDLTGQGRRCITNNAKSFRTFRGLAFIAGSSSTASGVNMLGTKSDVTFEDCYFQQGSSNAVLLRFADANSAITIRRCVFMGGYGGGSARSLNITNTSDDASGVVVDSCLFYGYVGQLCLTRTSSALVNNCTFHSQSIGVSVSTVHTDFPVIVTNCLFMGCSTGVSAGSAGMLVEDYNNIIACSVERSNVAVGAHSTAYLAQFDVPILKAGYALGGWNPFALFKQSALRGIVGSTPTTTDLWGITKPVTEAKRSWGAIQHNPKARETTTIDGATGTSLKMADAGRVQIRVPVNAASTVFSIKVYREADYAGDLPQMIIKQPGVADNVTTDTGAAAGWNTLSATLTPTITPPWVVVELVSRNTATAGNYAVYFDTLSVADSADAFETWTNADMDMGVYAQEAGGSTGGGGAVRIVPLGRVGL